MVINLGKTSDSLEFNPFYEKYSLHYKYKSVKAILQSFFGLKFYFFI